MTMSVSFSPEYNEVYVVTRTSPQQNMRVQSQSGKHIWVEDTNLENRYREGLADSEPCSQTNMVSTGSDTLPDIHERQSSSYQEKHTKYPNNLFSQILATIIQTGQFQESITGLLYLYFVSQSKRLEYSYLIVTQESLY